MPTCYICDADVQYVMFPICGCVAAKVAHASCINNFRKCRLCGKEVIGLRQYFTGPPGEFLIESREQWDSFCMKTRPQGSRNDS